MSISDDIRALAREGLGAADIARRLGVRYQHAYKVLKAGALQVVPTKPPAALIGAAEAAHKPSLTVETLIAGGFVFASRWLLSNTGDLALETPLPKAVGVYAFAKGSLVSYIGLATMGLAKRLYFYRKPGITQRTSQRLNGIMKGELLTVPAIDIYVALPSDLDWNGLPIHGCAGLELGLIKKYALPWNMRSTG